MIDISLLYPAGENYHLDSVPDHSESLVRDLELSILFSVMANNDDTILNAVRQIIMGQRSTQISVINFRQQILRDFIRYPELLSRVYQHSCDTLKAYHDSLRFWLSAKSSSRRLRSNVDILDMLLDQVASLRDLGESYTSLDADGLTGFFKFLQKYYDAETVSHLRHQSQILRMDKGFSVSAKLDHIGRSKDFFLNKNQPGNHWLKKLLPFNSGGEAFSFTISQRDESGLTALAEFRDAALQPVANVMDTAVQQLLTFFERLRNESAFYSGALNLYAALERRGCPSCFPTPISSEKPGWVASKIYDPCLAFSQKDKIITNDLQASNKKLIVITGTNSGGKSTFLRALGINQLLLQSGIVVAAQAFSASICDEVYTHFKLEEDTQMRSGKFDEELLRMAELVPKLKASAMILFNESFAATNEREGSEIAWQICNALIEKEMRVVFVTHLYTFAQHCYTQKMSDFLALRAMSGESVSSKFKISEAKPLSTSFAKDIYERIFPDKNI
ncbi:hypothetical protein B1757_14095 [Acidithiobacillus marinus]|uniref:DNA mismatch repair proteins mutS family domain-containing protein n=1 Tax=Acidithiobacillus marinus TaxID=187490 RepID=A0A2I1DIC0_9PROT|nr:hypothetical protein [Acidithiobacillus marinus]PKY09612.1 hypothetical protein B1757_14095 [Acidithiobacillus marinus]